MVRVKSAAVLAGISLWPFINLASQNRDELDLEGFVFLLVTPALLFIVAIAIVKGARHTLRAFSESQLVLALAVAIALFFNYLPIFEVLRDANLPRVNYIYLALAVLLPSGALMLGRRAEVFDAAVLIVAVLVAIPTIGLAWHSVREALQGSAIHPSAAQRSKPILDKRNVYIVITDGYARHDQLQRIYGFDNRPLLHQLRSHGFYVADKAFANYPITVLSLASSLNGEYILREGDTFYENRRFYERLRGNNSTINKLKAHGYAYVHAAASIWMASKCEGFEDYCIDFYSRLLGLGELLSIIVEITPLSLFGNVAIVSAPPISYLQSRVADILDSTQRPIVVFAHTFPPHPPHLYDEDCLPRDDPSYSWADKRQYVESVQCVNKQLISLAQFIEQRDPRALVIVQSDHGSQSTIDWKKDLSRWTKEEYEERYGVLLAIRAPEKCRNWLYPSISRVNLHEFLFACLEQRQPKFKEDASYLVDWIAGNELRRGRVLRYPPSKPKRDE